MNDDTQDLYLDEEQADFSFVPKRKPKKSQQITFDLGPAVEEDEDGNEITRTHVYRFNPPKSVVAILPVLRGNGGDEGQVAGAFQWMMQGLSEEDAERIYTRLSDEDDPLDMEDLMRALRQLTKAVTKRPTK